MCSPTHGGFGQEIPTVVTLTTSSGRWFEPSRGSHIGATILHPNTKVLDFQGLFVFLGVKNTPLSPLHLFLNLLDLNLRLYRTFEKSLLFWYNIVRKKESEDTQMKNGYTIVRRLKLTPFEIRVAIEALNVKRLNQKAHGIDNRETSNLILHLLDALEA